MDVRLSPYGQASTQPSPVNRMMAAFASGFRDGIDINLGVGYVNERTIPVEALEAALDAVAGDPVRYRQAFNYGSASGSTNLIESLCRFLSCRGGVDAATLGRKRLVIGACGATSLLDAMTDILPRGIVVTSDPAYYIYTDCLERKGFEIVAVPEDEEGISLEALHSKLAALGPRVDAVSFLYIVTVNNPSCTILSNRRRRALLQVAEDLSRTTRRRIPVFYDLAYELLAHDHAIEPFRSVLAEDELGLAYEIGTLSKVFAPALRIGYLLGPDGPLMSAVVQKTSDAGFSAPLFVQEMASWLLDNRIDAQLARVNAGYREKASVVREAIADELGPYIGSVRGGSAGFYFYLTFRELATHPASAFFRRLTRTTGDPTVDGPAGEPLPRVIYIPGTYCVHPAGDLALAGKRQLRLSYGFEDATQIVRAIRLMREAAAACAAARVTVQA